MNSRRRISALQRFAGKAYSHPGCIGTVLMAACVQGFGRRPIEEVRQAPGRRPKAFRERTRGSGLRRRVRYGDFGAVPADVGAADLASGVIGRRRGAGDGARDGRQRKLGIDLSLADLAG
jgi:hypothetical protein